MPEPIHYTTLDTLTDTQRATLAAHKDMLGKVTAELVFSVSDHVLGGCTEWACLPLDVIEHLHSLNDTQLRALAAFAIRALSEAYLTEVAAEQLGNAFAQMVKEATT